MAPEKIIIDTDPGVDDILALLLALSARADEVEILLLSATYGNIELQTALHNLVTLFHVIDKEIKWRKENKISEGYEAMISSKPLVAVGPAHPIEDESLNFMADFYHGVDGLAGCHTSHPQFSPPSTWNTLFQVEETKQAANHLDTFRVSSNPAHKEIIRLLRENPPDTITILALGPLTNLALAAAEDVETFLRAKEVVVMGGAVDGCGNATPCSEYNTYADPIAAARVFALTSPNPASTMPSITKLPPYPTNLSRTLNLTLFPTETTSMLLLRQSDFMQTINRLAQIGSPMAEWTSVFVNKIMTKVNPPGIALHDVSTVWYVLKRSSQRWIKSPKSPEDIRVETMGQWTRGMLIVDRRNIFLDESGFPEGDENIVGDDDGWLNKTKGNRINRIIDAPGADSLVPFLLDRIYGSAETIKTS
ncbi:hypothetical protein K3495_g437 [Podosphaera aphanis]|nr:hypothetical protein K3495_g437 [Podosphaera aphanis]